MKPDWKDAPEWANWLAMDSDGEWDWYEMKPVIFQDHWRPAPGKRQVAFRPKMEWLKSLELRPNSP